jgi:hypothetical protein
MFSAHFDESGTPDATHTVLTVAGCVSSIEKWVRFELQWNAILKDFDLPDGTIFHMNKFARNIRPYEAFENQPRRKAELISALVKCAKRNVNKAFSCTVALRDWERLNRRYCVAESFGYPYPLCGRTCVAMVSSWARKKAGASIQFFFEDGATHRGQLKKILMANDGIEPTFRTKEGMPQFQAADILAWKSRKVLGEVVGYEGPGDHDLYNSINRSLAEISSIPHKYGVHSYASMEPMIRSAKIPLRTGSK